MHGEVVPTRRMGLIERLRRWGRREPGFVSRMVALGLFCGVVQVFYPYVPNHPPALAVQLLLLSWIAMSWVCQQGLRLPGWADWAAYAWSATDVLFLTVVQVITAAHVSPIIIGYPFLIAGAVLWSKQRMVWVTTACAMLGYAWLMSYDLRAEVPQHPLHRHIVFLICLAVLWLLDGLLLRCVYACEPQSRYYERRIGR